MAAAAAAAGSLAVVSRIVPDEAVGRWEIQGLRRFQRRSSKAYSSGPVLVAGGSQFGLLMRLGGKDSEFASDLQVYAVNLSGKRTMGQHTIRVVSQARGRDGDVVLHGEPGLWDTKSEWGWKQAMSLESLEDLDAGFVRDDVLILELHMQVWDSEAVRTQGAPLGFMRPPSTTAGCFSSLSRDMSELLRSGRATDITVRGAGLGGGAAAASACPCSGASKESGECKGSGCGCGGASSGSCSDPGIQAHKIVLAARSPVFERLLFSSGMRETRQSFELRLEGADSRIANWFIHFLYSDEVALEAWEDQDALCYLLTLAHRYQVQPLWERCQARLVEQLDEESAPERLMMAEMLDSAGLKSAVLGYMCGSHRRLARIQATEAFARLVRVRPLLLGEILATVVPPAAKRQRLEGDGRQAAN